MRLRRYLTERAEANTEFLETSAMIGVVATKDVIKQVNTVYKGDAKKDTISKMLDGIDKILGKSYDWNPKGISRVKEVIANYETNAEGLHDLVCIIKGMNIFMEDKGYSMIGGRKAFFIHNKIKKYYDLEKELLGEIKGSKDNTADAIISSVSVEKILSGMKEKIEPDAEKGMVNIGGNGKIVQVSLKKSDSGAQMGKILNFIRKSLGWGVDTKTAVSALTTEELLNEQKESLKAIRQIGIINEGVLDKLKNVASNLWADLKKAIKNVSQKFSRKWLSIFSKRPDQSYVKEFYTKVIGMSESKITKSIEAIVEKISKNPGEAIKAINGLLKTLNNSVKGNDTILLKYNVLKPYPKIKGDQKTVNSVVFTLISNYLTLRTLIDMVKDEAKFGANVNRLLAEMMFGGTKLPLWKVFGDYGTGQAYSYLGTIDRFVSHGTNPIAVQLLGIRVNVNPNGYYTISVLMLDEADENGKTYISLRTGTNSSSGITFVFEGTKKVGPYPIDTPFIKILVPKG